MDFVDNQLDRGTGTIIGRARRSRTPTWLLAPGPVRAPAARRAAASTGALLIPDEADRQRPGAEVRLGGRRPRTRAQYRTVTIGPLHDGLRVVREGLDAGGSRHRQRPAARAPGHRRRRRRRRPIAPPSRPHAAGARRRRRRTAPDEHLALLHRPADLRRGPLDRHRDPRRHRLPLAAGGAVPGRRAADDRRARRPIPGAPPEVIADTVATPIEQEVNGVEDMLYMSSQSTTDGQMTLTITFQLGTDLDKAQVLVQNRVAIAEPRLPEDVRRIGVTTLKSSPDLLMVVHLLSPDKPLRPALHRQLRAHPGARRAARASTASATSTLFGLREYSMRVWLDPERLAEPQPHHQRRRRRRCASRTSRSPRASSASRRCPPGTPSSCR